jgi:hypothetical protein
MTMAIVRMEILMKVFMVMMMVLIVMMVMVVTMDPPLQEATRVEMRHLLMTSLAAIVLAVRLLVLRAATTLLDQSWSYMVRRSTMMMMMLMSVCQSYLFVLNADSLALSGSRC